MSIHPVSWATFPATLLLAGAVAAQAPMTAPSLPSSAIRPGIDAEQSMRGGPVPRAIMREGDKLSSVEEELVRSGMTPSAQLVQGGDPIGAAAAVRAGAARGGTAPPAGAASVTDLRQGVPSAAAIVDALRGK
jgi:hypothetical protein